MQKGLPVVFRQAARPGTDCCSHQNCVSPYRGLLYFSHSESTGFRSLDQKPVVFISGLPPWPRQPREAAKSSTFNLSASTVMQALPSPGEKIQPPVLCEPFLAALLFSNLVPQIPSLGGFQMA